MSPFVGVKVKGRRKVCVDQGFVRVDHHSRPRHKTGRWAPHLPHGIVAHATSATKAKDSGTLRVPLDPEASFRLPGTPMPGRRPGSVPGANVQNAKEISLPAPAGSS